MPAKSIPGKDVFFLAFLQTHFFSTSLCFGTDLNVFIPTPNVDELMVPGGADYYHPGAKFPVLYLLHGGYGDYTDWMRLTSIERYAQAKKLAVIMPSASNSFYQDMTYGSDYLRFITQEVPQLCESLFPISTRREHTYVGGLSMGGYGALKVGLTCPEKFSHVFSLSGALDVMATLGSVNDGNRATPLNPYTGERKFAMDPAAVFGTTDVRGTDADLFTLAEKVKAAGKPLPRLFQSVGTEDFLCASNRTARDTLRGLGMDVTYEEHPGAHEWNYWDTNVQRALDWLPLTGESVEA